MILNKMEKRSEDLETTKMNGQQTLEMLRKLEKMNGRILQKGAKGVLEITARPVRGREGKRSQQVWQPRRAGLFGDDGEGAARSQSTMQAWRRTRDVRSGMEERNHAIFPSEGVPGREACDGGFSVLLE